ncbi:MAG: hypothetical protein V4631_09010 [Pseudomonadota bacterium]
MRSPAISIVEQRFLRGPSLWSGKSCLVTVLDMGPMAHALSSDIPGLGERILSLFPGMHDYAEPLRRGSFIAEVLGRMALELQRMAGAPTCKPGALTVHGRRGQVRIVVHGAVEQLAVQAFELAADIVMALCSGRKVALRVRLAALRRTAQLFHPERWPRRALSASLARAPGGEGRVDFMHGHPGEHGQHEQQRLVAAAC